MTHREQGTPERPSADEIANWAFDLLRRHLIEHGHAVLNVRRPDRTNRTSRDVDFLVEIDGRDIAVEVTQLTQAREWWNLLDRLESRVRAATLEHDFDPGWLMISINLLRTGSYREVDEAGTQIVQAVRDAPTNLGARSWDRLTTLPEPARSLAEVELRRASETGPRITFIKQNEAHGALIAPRALAFVRHLLASKETQAVGYEEVWILVIDNEVIIDIHNLDEAFAEEEAHVPPNWTRLFFIPATDRNVIEALEFKRRDGT